MVIGVVLFFCRCLIYFNLLGIQVGFSAGDRNNAKLKKMLRWTRPAIHKPDNDTDHYDVFSYVSKYVCLTTCRFHSGQMSAHA